MLPVALIFLGVVASAAVAWGADPSLAERSAGGIAFVCLMHRLQWLLIGVAVISGLGLASLVTFGRRRAWWLIGLVPVVALFAWRFAASGEQRSLWVDDQPALASTAQAGWLAGDDVVIGLAVDGQAYAFPVRAMGRAPVVVMNLRERRLMVAWSAGARAATAAWIDRTVRGRDLEIVSSPAGVLMLYNGRLGEFFDALTLRTPADRRAAQGVLGRLETTTTSWETWREQHPETLVLQPRWPPAEATGDEDREGVALVFCEPPMAVSGAIGEEPRNLAAGGEAGSVVVFRKPGGTTRAFDRRVDSDLFLQLALRTDRKTGRKSLVDGDTGSTWSFDGVAVDGPLKGTRLRPIIVQEGVSPAAVRFWAPDAVSQ